MTDVLHRNHVQVQGAGPPLLFAHGFGCDQTAWRQVAPRFTHDHTVITLDHVGAGRSDASAFDPVRHATLGGYAQDLVEVCAALNLSAVTLVAHSAGTMIGLLAALTAPHLFSQMVLLAPSPRFLNDPPDYLGGFDAADIDGLLSLMDANFLGWATSLSQMALPTPTLAQELHDRFCAAEPRILRAFARACFLSDHRPALPRVTTPCLVVQCAHDDFVPLSVGTYMATHLPRATLQHLDVPGHMPHISHPDEIVALLRAFLERPPGAGP